MEAVLLGSGGWIPTSTRETCSLLLRDGPTALLIDAGTGVQRLVERPELLDGADGLQIMLTHFHLDHVVGLSYIPALALEEAAVVWGPAEQLLGVSTRAILDRLLGPPLFSAAFAAVARDVREVPTGAFDVGPFALETRVQERHSEPTLAIRVGDDLTYCTDTAADPGNAVFAEGSQILLHEAWHVADSSDDPAHTAAGDAARIAVEAGVAGLVLIHVNPLLESDDALAEPARRVFDQTEVGVDLARLPLN